MSDDTVLDGRMIKLLLNQKICEMTVSQLNVLRHPAEVVEVNDEIPEPA